MRGRPGVRPRAPAVARTWGSEIPIGIRSHQGACFYCCTEHFESARSGEQRDFFLFPLSEDLDSHAGISDTTASVPWSAHLLKRTSGQPRVIPRASHRAPRASREAGTARAEAASGGTPG